MFGSSYHFDCVSQWIGFVTRSHKEYWNSQGWYRSVRRCWFSSLRHDKVVRYLPWSRGYTSDFLLAMAMRFFGKLSRCQRAVKIACVATLAQVMRQEKIAEKFNELNFLQQITVFVRGWLHLRFSCVLATRQFRKNRITIASKKSLV